MEHPEARLQRIEAQLAGLFGILRAVWACLPEDQLETARRLAHGELESVHAVILADDSPHAESSIEGLETLRASFFPK